MGKENFIRQVEDSTKLSLETAGFQEVVGNLNRVKPNEGVVKCIEV
jgi:hypothetical protein